MFDPILKQSIQRWENEGGLYQAHLYTARRDQNLDQINWNKFDLSWNEINTREPARSTPARRRPSDYNASQ